MKFFDVCLLQEIHLCVSDENIIECKWSRKIFWNHRDSRTAGTAILLADKFNSRILDVVRSEESHFLAIIVDFENVPLVLCNGSVPSWAEQTKLLKKVFFQTLQQTLKDLNYPYYLIGRDFNCILNEDLDRNTYPFVE